MTKHDKGANQVIMLSLFAAVAVAFFALGGLAFVESMVFGTALFLVLALGTLTFFLILGLFAIATSLEDLVKEIHKIREGL